jgi:hypothetical protein
MRRFFGIISLLVVSFSVQAYENFLDNVNLADFDRFYVSPHEDSYRCAYIEKDFIELFELLLYSYSIEDSYMNLIQINYIAPYYAKCQQLGYTIFADSDSGN